jgi:hypothetical protein
MKSVITVEVPSNFQERQYYRAKERYTLHLAPIIMGISSKTNFIRVESSFIPARTTIMEHGSTIRPQASANSIIIKE